MQKHTFRAPAKPIEPPTPRTSVLGLDRLAEKKRAAAAKLEQDDSKRQRRPADDAVFKVPALPASRSINARHRGEETPSHPGGLSEGARQKLDAYRKNRDQRRGKFLRSHYAGGN